MYCPPVSLQLIAKGHGRVRYLLIDACATRVLDLTALGCLAEAVEQSHFRGVQMRFSNCSTQLLHTLDACHLLDDLGGQLVSLSTEAVYVLTLQEIVSKGKHWTPPRPSHYSTGWAPHPGSYTVVDSNDDAANGPDEGKAFDLAEMAVSMKV